MPTQRLHIVATLSLIAGLALPLAAADDDEGPMKILDLRIAIGAVPPSVKHQETSAQGLVVQSFDLDKEEFEIGSRVEIGLYESLGTVGRGGALVMGLSVAFQDQDTDGISRVATINDGSGNTFTAIGPVELSVVVVDLHVGWAWALARRTHIELVPFIGYGSANVEDKFNAVGTTAFSGDGPYWEAGARIGIYYSHPTGMQIGADVGFMYGQVDTSIDTQIGGGVIGEINYQVTILGPTANVSIGLRF